MRPVIKLLSSISDVKKKIPHLCEVEQILINSFLTFITKASDLDTLLSNLDQEAGQKKSGKEVLIGTGTGL